MPGVFIESKKGGKCLLVNPWKDAKVSIVDGRKSGAEVAYQVSSDGVIGFETKEGHNYFIKRFGTSDSLIPTNYFSVPNQLPKIFFEASIGKERNF